MNAIADYVSYLPAPRVVNQNRSTILQNTRVKDVETEAHAVLSVAQIPSDAMLFRFPRGLARMMLGSSMLFASAAVLFAVTLSGKHQVVLGIALLVPFVAMSVLSFRTSLHLSDHVAVNSNGIWYVPRSGQFLFLAWHEVGTVVADDVQQRLRIVDANGRTTIRLEYQLENFPRLREFVLSHTTSGRVDTHPITTFHRTWINKTVFLFFSVPMLLVAWMSAGRGQWGASLTFVVFAAILLLSITLDPLRVVVEPQGIVIEYPGWKRKIPFLQVTDISLKDENFRGNVFAVVVIRKSQGKPIKLYRFREGSLALHETLNTAWRRAGSHSC